MPRSPGQQQKRVTGSSPNPSHTTSTLRQTQLIRPRGIVLTKRSGHPRNVTGPLQQGVSAPGAQGDTLTPNSAPKGRRLLHPARDGTITGCQPSGRAARMREVPSGLGPCQAAERLRAPPSGQLPPTRPQGEPMNEEQEEAGSAGAPPQTPTPNHSNPKSGGRAELPLTSPNPGPEGVTGCPRPPRGTPPLTLTSPLDLSTPAPVGG